MKPTFFPFILLISSGLMSSCGNDNASPTVSSSSTTDRGTVVASAVQNTAPYIDTTSSLYGISDDDDYYGEGDYGEDDGEISTKGDSWTAGSGNYEIYNLMRKYTYPDDEGVLDMTNMYKALYEIKEKLNDGQSTCSSNAITEKTITAPFASFSTSYAYNCAYNDGTLSDSYASGIAMKESSGVYNILYGWQWAGNANGGSVGVAQATYDSVNSSLVYEMVNCVNCGGNTNNFTVRTYISGNPTDHTFTIRTINRSSSGIKAIVGKGTSQGSGNYMLFKYTTNGSTFTYYCLSSNAIESDFRDATGSSTIPSNCSNLETDVDALTFFTSGDAPFALSDFTNSTILLSY